MVGIYVIRNLKNGKCYYGSSKDIKKRWRVHRNQLNSGKHHNTHLQRSWVNYGNDNFIFEVVEECSKELLLEREQYYLDLKPEYNIGLKSSGGDNLSKNPNKGDIIHRMTETIKKRYDSMSDEEKKEKHSRPKEKNPNWKGGVSVKYCECGKEIAPINSTCVECRDRFGENNPFYGKTHSEETKKILSEKRKGKKPSNIKPFFIGDIKYLSLMDAEKDTGIKATTIRHRIISKNDKYDDYYYINNF